MFLDLEKADNYFGFFISFLEFPGFWFDENQRAKVNILNYFLFKRSNLLKLLIYLLSKVSDTVFVFKYTKRMCGSILTHTQW